MIWDFLQRYDDSWIWRCTDHHEVMESTRNFAGLEECIEDASRHGYVRSPAAPRRNRREAVRAINQTRRPNSAR